MDGSPERARPVRTPGLPGIAIVTPCYQSADYLEDAIVSVLDQGYPALEYVVVDGGSTDGSVEIIERHADRLAAWVSEPDDGPYHALNKGFAKTSAEVMGYLNADDVLLPGALLLVGELFIRFPEMEWLSGAHMALREDGAPVSVTRAARWSRWHLLSDLVERFLPQESTFWRRSLWDRAGGGFDERFRLAGDFELWARFSRTARPFVTEAPLGCFRHAPGQRSVAERTRYRAEVAQVRRRERARAPADRRAAALASGALSVAGEGTWIRRLVDAAIGGSPRLVFEPAERGFVRREDSTMDRLAFKAFRVAAGQEPAGVTAEKLGKLGRHVYDVVDRPRQRARAAFEDRRVAARPDFHRRAFHGDRIYQAVIEELIEEIPVGAFVETGTHLGDSAGFVATRHPEVAVHSCDVDGRALARATRRLRGARNVRLYRTSSERLLRALVGSGHLRGTPMFFLDAHWHGYWPLENELEAIASGGPAVIVIDDFRVPDRPEFGFDVWPSGPAGQPVACDLDLVAGHLRPDRHYRLLVPDYGAGEAFPGGHGPLRGHVVVFQDLPEAFDRLRRGEGPVASSYRPVEAPPPPPSRIPEPRARPRPRPVAERAGRAGAWWASDPWAAQRVLLGDVRRPVVLDVGAHVGGTLRRYLELFPRARAHCFEPSPESFRELERVAGNRPGVSVHRIALSDHRGQATLHTSAAFPATDSLLPQPLEGRRYVPRGAEGGSAVTVSTETLDAFCAEHGIDRVHILKMDVQGGEGAVVAGARGLLARGAIDLVYTEVLFVPHYEGAALFPELAATLGEHGYSLYGLYDLRSASNGQLSFGDAIFVSPRLRREVVDALPPEP